MAGIPVGPDARIYDEVRMLVKAYADQLRSKEDMSHAEMTRTIDRLTKLGNDARRLWGEK
jgi:hypothetical protein